MSGSGEESVHQAEQKQPWLAMGSNRISNQFNYSTYAILFNLF